MKKLFTLLILLVSLITSAQEEDTKVAYFKNEVSKITSLKMTSNSTQDLETINWKDIRSIFEYNNPEEKIELSFELDLKESKDKFKSAVTVGGHTEEIDSLITKSKKLIKMIIKLSKNYENK
ncbi:hypothetical protein LPB03_14720 [Polaribacter vadi]|uniref:Uncharacterized protein n=1 Tax=Polaribacter vadi TaxID=1774273 RepID=A0A1B8TR22_9FLAO|nr:hypothetical protein [Polaribacter vadi]AOW18632.1 hypothetical protein LPB03_14720 [Polaribacter vadi]OBY62005.1 hypothetical protein LPB3_14585 [Polaribacter vadi]